MARRLVDEVLGGLTGVDHEPVLYLRQTNFIPIPNKFTYCELHALSTRSPELAADDNLATLGTALHNESQDTVASSSNGETVEELVAERLALCHGRETAVLYLGGVERDGVFGEFESFLNERGEFANAATLLTEDFLGVRGPDDDVGDGGSDADFDAGVALFSQLALEKFVEFGVEDAVYDSN